MPTTINLLRHAEAFNNVCPTNYIGDELRDSALTDQGHFQTAQLRPQLHKMRFDSIYCSPLQRCRQTLKAVYPRSVYLNVQIADSLLEQPYGTHVCNHRAELGIIKASSPNPWSTTLVSEINPHRVLKKKLEYQIIRDFAKMLVQKHPDQTVLLVTHGRWISRFLKLFCNLRHVHINNCQCLQVVLEPDLDLFNQPMQEEEQEEDVVMQVQGNTVSEPVPKRARHND